MNRFRRTSCSLCVLGGRGGGGGGGGSEVGRQVGSLSSSERCLPQVDITMI